MKKCVCLFFLFLLMLGSSALAQEKENFIMTATVTKEESALLSLPASEADVLLPLHKDDSMVILALGTHYCRAETQLTEGYVALEDIAFDVLKGRPTQLARVNASETNLLSGRASLREEADPKSTALIQIARQGLMLLLGEEGKMYHVAVPGYIGYIRKDNVLQDVTADDYRIAYLTNDDRVNQRLCMQFADRFVIQQLEPGTPVQYIREYKGWGWVEYNGYKGYIMDKYLSFTPPEG